MHVSQIGGSSGISATSGMNPDRGGDASHPMAGGLLCLGAPAPCRTSDSPAMVFLKTAGATLAAPRAAAVGGGRPGWSGIFRGRVRVTEFASEESTAVPFSRKDEAGPNVCRKPPHRGGVQKGDSDAGTPLLKRKWDGEPKKGGKKESSNIPSDCPSGEMLSMGKEFPNEEHGETKQLSAVVLFGPRNKFVNL